MRPSSKLSSSLILTTCLAITSGTAAFAQYEPQKTIAVSADAQINVVPDKVLITLGVETIDADLRAAKTANDDSCAKIISTARSFKIAAKDIQTDFISIQPQYSSRDVSRPYELIHIVGYTVHKSMQITLRDFSTFDSFLSTAVAAGANHVLNIEFRTSDLRRYRDQVRESAIKAAREKADALASALGQKVGKAISIRENQSNSWSSYDDAWRDRSYNRQYQSQNVSQSPPSNDSGAEGEATAPGQTRVSAAVYIVFQLVE